MQKYREEESAGGVPYFLCSDADAERLPDFRVLNLGATPEQMAARLYAALREGEKKATLIVAIRPEGEGGVMDGVLNRLTRACRGN